MQYLGYLKYTDTYTSFSFSVFVVWKIVADGERKSQAIVDIWKLNDLVIPDTYTLLLQSDIIANMQGCTNLAVLNITAFFY